MNKKCSRCFVSKPFNLEFFPKEVNKKSGLASHCRECYRKHSKKRIENLNYSTPETKVCNHCGIEKPCNTEHFHRHNKNKTGFRGICKACRIPKTRAYATTDKYRERARKRRKADPVWKLKNNVSVAIIHALKKADSSKSGGKTFEHLPYSPQQLKEHLEAQFEPWMTWENWGTAKGYTNENRTWNIDHIVPQSKLKYQSMKDKNFQKCWALENLRPLDALENIKKRDKDVIKNCKNKENIYE